MKYGLIIIPNIVNCTQESNQVQESLINVTDRYKDIFEGKGVLGEPHKIVVDASITPVINPPRRVPFAIMQEVKDKLKELEEKGIIKKVTEPT